MIYLYDIIISYNYMIPYHIIYLFTPTMDNLRILKNQESSTSKIRGQWYQTLRIDQYTSSIFVINAFGKYECRT